MKNERSTAHVAKIEHMHIMSKHTWAIALLVGWALLSCGKENPGDDPVQPEGPVAGPAETQVTLPSAGPLSVYNWASSDQISIGGESFSLASGADTKVGTFKGKSLKDRFYAIGYPARIKSLENFLDFSFTQQQQTGNGSSAHLRNTVFIDDVTSYEAITLSEQWASSKSGSFRSNGVLALSFTLPASPGKVESIVLESAGIKFPTNNAGDETASSIVLSMDGVTPTSGQLDAFISVPEKKLEIAKDHGLKITIVAEQSYKLVWNEAVTMGGGILTEIKVTDPSAFTPYSAISGEGTQASPYILKTPEDLLQLKELMIPEGTVWMEMANDIDMSDVLNWEPLNNVSPYNMSVHFDGKGHTLKNFTCSDKNYPSFFGVLAGYCGNVTFQKAEITSSTNGWSMGVVGGYSGVTNGASAVVENVKVIESTVSTTVQQESTFPVGGMFGTIINSTVKNCSFEGTVDNKAYGLAANPDRCSTGGIAGKMNTTSTIEGCTSKGTISSERCRYTGGIVGWVSPGEDIVIKDCINEANVTGGADRAAGIAGHFQQGTVQGCVNKGAISCGLVGSVSGAGGIVGYSGPCKIIDCVNEGSVSGTKNAVGGIIGYAEMKSSVERCSSTGTITAGGRYVGGIAGGLKVAESTISNCWTGGSVIATSDQEAGGIVGSMMTGQSVSCCYSVAEVKAQRVAGGIVGRACNNAWTYNSSTITNTIVKCIAWNPSVTATSTGDVNTVGGSGVIVGFTSFYNTLNNGWRSPNLVFTASDTVNNVAVDQPDCSPSSPFVMGTTPGTAGKYGCPYHGKVASGSDTVTSLAISMGWDSSVWNLTGNLPTLKR